MIGLNYEKSVADTPQNNAAEAIAADRSSGKETKTSSKAELFDQFMKEKMGVSKGEFEKAMDSQVTPDEVDAELISQGIDPATATDDQRASATLRVKLGKTLGLTPVEVDQVMAAQIMSPSDLQKILSNSIEAAATGGGESIMKAVLKGSEAKAVASEEGLGIEPPATEMSLTSFINAIVKAIETVLIVKASTQINDAQITSSKLKDILVMTEQKISQADKANKEMVSSLKKDIETMKMMRILMYTVLSIVLAIMIVLAAIAIAAATVATAGTATVPVALAMVSVISLVMTAVSTALIIAMTEKRRKGELSDQEAQDMAIAVMVVEIIAIVCIVGAAQGVMAKIVAQIVANIVASIARMVAMITTSEVAEIWAKRRAKDNFKKSDEKKEIEDKAADKTKEIDAKAEAGTITVDEANSMKEAVETDKNNELNNAEGKYVDAEVDKTKKTMEIVTWVVLALSIASGLGAIAASMSSAAREASKQAAAAIEKAMGAAMKALLDKVTQVLSAVQQAVGAMSTVFQTVKTVQMETQRQVHLEKMLEIKQLSISLEAVMSMFEDIKSNLDASAQQSADSMQKLTQALSAAFDANAKVMSDLAG